MRPRRAVWPSRSHRSVQLARIGRRQRARLQRTEHGPVGAEHQQIAIRDGDPAGLCHPEVDHRVVAASRSFWCRRSPRRFRQLAIRHRPPKPLQPSYPSNEPSDLNRTYPAGFPAGTAAIQLPTDPVSQQASNQPAPPAREPAVATANSATAVGRTSVGWSMPRLPASAERRSHRSRQATHDPIRRRRRARRVRAKAASSPCRTRPECHTFQRTRRGR